MPFQVGQIVAPRAGATRIGSVVEVLPAIDCMAIYRVFHTRDPRGNYAEDQLAALIETTPTSHDLLLGLSELLPTGLEGARLSRPASDHVYALHAAGVRLISLLFKPMLSMLCSERPRLLSAEEVGVGKGIEVTLVLKEHVDQSEAKASFGEHFS